MNNSILYDDEYFKLTCDGKYLIKKNLESVKGVLYANLALNMGVAKMVDDNNAYVEMGVFDHRMQRGFIAMYLTYVRYRKSKMVAPVDKCDKRVIEFIRSAGDEFKIAW